MSSILAKMAVQISANTADFNKKMAESSKALAKIGDQTTKTNSILTAFGRTIGGIGITAGLTALAKSVFDVGVKSEQTAIAFNTFLGSAEKGKRLLKDLTQFAIVTPFSPDQVNAAAKSLLAFGVSGDKVIPTLKLLGDVSSGTGKDLSEMAIIFGQIRSTGRLMGQDLLQLINAGFNPLQIISEKTGKSVGDLKKEMEKGLISFDMVEQAFKDATSEGGLFFNLMEKQSQSVGGKISTLAGNFDELKKKVFEANKGGISDFVDYLIKITDLLSKPTQEPIYLSDPQLKRLKEFAELEKNYGTIQPSYWDILSKKVYDYFTLKSRLTKEDLNLQLLQAKANYDAGVNTKQNIELIRDLSNALGLLPKGTTEDPLPWGSPEVVEPKVKTLRTLDDVLKSIQARYDKLNSLARKEFEKPLEAGKLPNSTGSLVSPQSITDQINSVIPALKALPEQMRPIFFEVETMFSDLAASAQGMASIIGDSVGAAFSGAMSGIDILRRATSEIVDLFARQAIAAAIANAAKFGGPFPFAAVALATAAAGAMKGLLNRVGVKSSGGVGGGGVARTSIPNSSSGLAQNSFNNLSLETLIRGQDLYVVLSNYERNNKSTRG